METEQPITVTDPVEPLALWRQLAQAASLELADEQIQRFEDYLDLLTAANARMNLTRIVDRQQARIHHIGDALTLLPWMPAGEFRLADVGSGGGVPGIPLAIALPRAQVVLVESTRKKAVFLREAVDALKLTNVHVTDSRAEDLGRPEAVGPDGAPARQSFDVVTARAVATLDWLVEWCLPLIKKRGRMLAMKGEKVADELEAGTSISRRLGGGVPKVHSVALPGTHRHVIVEIEKIGSTDKRYPRLATSAKGNPL